MKVRVVGEGHDFALSLPTKLLFNPLTLRMLMKTGRAGAALETLPPKAWAMVKLLDRERRRRGPWTLVEVNSANGYHIKVML